MTLAALFVAQATNTHLTLMQQLTILAVAVLTSKGASGVQGASFIALVATLTVIPTIPGGGNGVDSGNRPLHEHVPRDGQYDRQRRGNGRRGALGKEVDQRQSRSKIWLPHNELCRNDLTSSSQAPGTTA